MAGPCSPVNPANPAKAASRRLCRARLAAAGFSTGMSDVRSCEARDRLAIVVRSMGEASCGGLPVLENGRVVAMVTDRDICLALAKRNARPGDMTVREVMSKAPLHSISKEEDVDRALQLMRRWRVRRLPVIDRSGVLHGIISMNDIVRSTGHSAAQVRRGH